MVYFEARFNDLVDCQISFADTGFSTRPKAPPKMKSALMNALTQQFIMFNLKQNIKARPNPRFNCYLLR
ncbi:hypothetical protein PALB_8810 [Pseudoalteromonas luteoviolacea B = ATCC 29581]|nr:hypothetical protein PALB_8810 [Pseudoalteromonas luteoviolacea B = ATCC 29581]